MITVCVCACAFLYVLVAPVWKPEQEQPEFRSLPGTSPMRNSLDAYILKRWNEDKSNPLVGTDTNNSFDTIYENLALTGTNRGMQFTMNLKVAYKALSMFFLTVIKDNTEKLIDRSSFSN